jgi:hypothetical protein
MPTMTDIEIVRDRIELARLGDLAQTLFGDLVKAVVDVNRQVLAIGAELHSDEEAALLDDGSGQDDLWGINLYPDEFGRPDWIEFDSMINIRPRLGNRSRSVEDSSVRDQIRAIVNKLVAK